MCVNKCGSTTTASTDTKTPRQTYLDAVKAAQASYQAALKKAKADYAAALKKAQDDYKASKTATTNAH